MIFILIIILLVVFLVIMASTIALKIIFCFDTDENYMDITFTWAAPIIKGKMIIQNGKPILTLYFLKIKIYEKTLKAKKGEISKISKKQMFDSVKFEKLDIVTNYGFNNVITTGIACAVVSFLTEFIEISSIQQNADFLTGHDYIYIKVEADVNIVITLINYFKIKLQKEKNNHGKQYKLER